MNENSRLPYTRTATLGFRPFCAILGAARPENAPSMINRNFNNASSENNAFFNQLFKYNIKITAQNIFTRKKGVKIIMDNTRKDTCTCKKCKENKGVACDVTNCYYHDGECHCTAEKISVGPSYATSCTDTVCATFRQKNI